MKKHPLLAVCVCLAWPLFMFSQKEDNVWILGQNHPPLDTSISLQSITFSNNSPNVQLINVANFSMDITNTSISDSLGNLLCYTNGVSIQTKEHKTMQNGDALHNPLTWDKGYPTPQGALLLPIPQHPDSLILILSDYGSFIWPFDGQYKAGSVKTTWSIIDMKQNGGLGKAVEKRVLLNSDTLVGGQITACRHGNGRDWWVLLPEYGTNRYYRYLISPKGITDEGPQAVGLQTKVSLGQAVFSPDGKWYARYNSVTTDSPNWVDIYHFDRCAGLLSDHIQFSIDTVGSWGGIAFSPNSQLLYVSTEDTLYQFDMQATDILLSKVVVAVRDSNLMEGDPNSPILTKFFLMQLAPDGKIYVNVSYVSKYLHVVDQPDLKGPACHVIQHGLYLGKYNSFSLPNFPFFRLGKAVGSGCDTIAIAVNDVLYDDKSIGMLSPNPSTGVFQYCLENPIGESASIFITDLMSSVVFKQPILSGETAIQVNVAHLPAGIYLFEIHTANRRLAVEKLLISKP